MGALPPDQARLIVKNETGHGTSDIQSKAKADAQEIEKLLSELRSLKVSTFEADGAEINVLTQLEKSGLDDPRIQVKLIDGGNTYVLDIGSSVPSENGTQGKRLCQGCCLSRCRLHGQ